MLAKKEEFCLLAELHKKGSRPKLPQSLLVPPFSRQCRAVSIFTYALFLQFANSQIVFRPFLRRYVNLRNCQAGIFYEALYVNIFIAFLRERKGCVWKLQSKKAKIYVKKRIFFIIIYSNCIFLKIITYVNINLCEVILLFSKNLKT